MGAAFGGIAVALAEARAAAGDGVAGPGFGAMALADLGVVTPVALGVGAVVAGAAFVLSPAAAFERGAPARSA